MHSLAIIVDGLDLVAIFLAIFIPSFTDSLTGTTLLTRPLVDASSAPMKSPVIQSSIALDLPIALVNLWVPPIPGMTPRLISGYPNLALSPATKISHIMASSQPPPNAKPLTTPIMGFLTFGI